MDFWRILDIEPTTDKSIIKEAYMDKLNLYHPEEDPEGFQKLREAYELALKESDKVSESEIDNSPIGLWLQKVEDIYNTFSKRIDIYYWEELLQDDICFQIDTSHEVSEKLLVFLMDNFRLPHEIWQLLDEHFFWIDKKDELYNKFPTQFIDYIISEVNYEDALEYKLFEGYDDANFDEWFRLFYKIKDALSDSETETAKKLLDEIEALQIKHPELDILKIRYLLQVEDVATARQMAQDLVDRYSDNSNCHYTLAQVQMYDKKLEEAKIYYQKALDLNESHIGACVGMGDCCLGLEEYEAAQKYYEKARSAYPYSNYIRQCLYNTSQGLAKVLAEKAEQEPDNIDNLINLGWTYYNINDYENAQKIADKIQDYDKPQFYDLQGRINSVLGNYKKSLDYFKEWLQNIDEETDINYIYHNIAAQYQHLEDYDNALEFCDKVINNKDADLSNIVGCLNMKANIFNKLEKFNEAVDLCSKAIEMDNNLAHLYMDRAKAFFNLGKYQEAFKDCEQVNEIYPYFAESYLIQTKIYFYSNELEQSLDIIKTAEELNLDSGEMKLYKARILNHLDKFDESKEIYLKLIEEEPENDLVYYNFAYLYSDLQDYDNCLNYINKSIELNDQVYKYYLRSYVYRKINKFNDSLKDYNYILQNEPNSERAYEGRALAYIELNQYDFALEDYKKVLEINPKSYTVYNDLGELYERKNMLQKALECYNKQLEIDNDDYYYINRGWCYIKMLQYEKATNDFNTVIERNPNNIYAYNGIGQICKKQSKYKEAIEYFEKIIDLKQDYRYVYRYIAECYEELEDYKHSIDYYTQAIEKYPDDETFYLDRGLIYSDIEDYTNALKDYKKALEIYPDYSYAYNNMGLVYRDLKQYDKAEYYFKQALEKNSDNYRTMGNLADLYLYHLEQYNKAIELFSNQLKIVNDEPDTYAGRGEAYFKLGNIKKSTDDYKKALDYYLKQLKDLDDYACIYKDIGLCYQRLNQFNEAIKYYNKAIELAPACNNCTKKQCHESYYRLGQIEEQQSNKNKALNYYKKALEISKDDEDYIEAYNRLNTKSKKSSSFKDIFKGFFKN